MSDATETFEEFAARERERLTRERETKLIERRGIDKCLADIDREFAAIDAYASAKRGKVLKPNAQRTIGETRAPRGKRREELMDLIASAPEGLSRGDILERQSLKGDRAGEMAVSNALTGMIKAGWLYRDNGRYRVASADRVHEAAE